MSLIQEYIDNMGSDKARSAGDDDFHLLAFLIIGVTLFEGLTPPAIYLDTPPGCLRLIKITHHSCLFEGLTPPAIYPDTPPGCLRLIINR